jgi:hypothetical protein
MSKRSCGIESCTTACLEASILCQTLLPKSLKSESLER